MLAAVLEPLTLVRYVRSQLGSMLFVLFAAYSAHVRVLPYMSPSECGAVLADHVARSLSSPLHMRLRTTLQGIHARGRKAARKGHASVFVDGHVDYAAAFGRLADWLFK